MATDCLLCAGIFFGPVIACACLLGIARFGQLLAGALKAAH